MALAPALACGPRPEVLRASVELDGLTRPLAPLRRETFDAILADALAKDPYVCTPSPLDVFFGDIEPGVRHVSGPMPHYGVFIGPMSYLVRKVAPSGEADGGIGGYRVEATIALEPARGEEMELADCGLRGARGLVCRGTPYAASRSTEACPGSGTFRAPATRENLRALLARWSREAERYFNRDAEDFGLPVRYDFDFVLEGEPEAAGRRIDLRLGLALSCGRTPYFASFRTGWSLPVVAHEVGHVLGLLDEYEPLSGIVSFYPKTPFPGAEGSRMGLSMREGTRVLPIHHYLIVRRFFCPEPHARDPFAHVHGP